jgi:hypothetical protein
MLIGKGNSNAMVASNFSNSHSLTSTNSGMRNEIRVSANLNFAGNHKIDNVTVQNSFPVTLNYN